MWKLRQGDIEKKCILKTRPIVIDEKTNGKWKPLRVYFEEEENEFNLRESSDVVLTMFDNNENELERWIFQNCQITVIEEGLQLNFSEVKYINKMAEK